MELDIFSRRKKLKKLSEQNFKMGLTEEQLNYYEQLVREAQLDAESEKTKNYQQEVMMDTKEKSMIAEQLDLGDELDRIDYLLRGYTIERDDNTGESKWVRPDNNEMIILSDYGVHLIRNTIAWYLNKNTLLSNYDEDTINHKMEDFADSLNDTIFMEYEKVFQYPTFKDCKIILQERLDKKKEIRMFAMEVLGKEVSKEQEGKIETDIMNQIEPIIERELSKIKEQIIKNKLKRFMIIIREVQDAVHSTYLRAWKGQERTTLRQHIHISETKGGMMPMPNQPSNVNPMNWFRKR